MLFRCLFDDFEQIGPFLRDQNDIIIKDVRRLDPDMINQLHFNLVYPALSPDSFKASVMLILRLIVRFELSKKQSLVFTAEYLQGMHEIVAFILYTFVN